MNRPLRGEDTKSTLHPHGATRSKWLSPPASGRPDLAAKRGHPKGTKTRINRCRPGKPRQQLNRVSVDTSAFKVSIAPRPQGVCRKERGACQDLARWGASWPRSAAIGASERGVVVGDGSGPSGAVLSTALYLWETGPRAYASQEAGFPQAPRSGGAVGKTVSRHVLRGALVFARLLFRMGTGTHTETGRCHTSHERGRASISSYAILI